MKNINYIVRKLSSDDPDFTIDLLLDIIKELEEDLDRTQSSVNKLNTRVRELENEIKEANRKNFIVKVGECGVGFSHDV